MTDNTTPAFDVLAFGRVSMDLYPEQTGPFSEVASFAKSLGGSATNVAVASARLGRSAALVSGVGKDRPGAYVRTALAQFGVDDRFVTTHPTLHTPLVLAELNPAEDPGLEFYRAPSAPDLHLDLGLPGLRESLAQAAILWVTGTGLSVNESFVPTLDAMKLHYVAAAAAAVDPTRAGRPTFTVLDLDWRPMLWPVGSNPRAKYSRALEHANVVVGNRSEVAVALKLDESTLNHEQAAQLLLEAGAEIAIVKLGGDGVYVATSTGDAELVPPTSVEVVCGLGAGDAFGGALCDGLLSGLSPVEAVARASAAGAFVAGQLACADAMPTADQLEDFIDINSARGSQHA
ncbi:MAG: 5-dehydro-2-deoxygluconokinase [Thermoleophilia bacterium]|nr:5-dehydro-2-deoxygluconokinase [Thermoleophilia bacterium]